MSGFLAALALMAAMALLLGLILGAAAVWFKVDDDPLVARIDAILPQTQCGQCGHPGCRPYAEALAEGADDINRCPPGGEDGIRKLAELLGVEFKPFGDDAPQPKPKAVAVIDENNCIGCTLCIQACPVDAILGSAKLMHTVIAAECTGCELCIAPCPVDCIEMRPLSDTLNHWKPAYPVVAIHPVRA